MRIEIVEDADALAGRAADVIGEVIRRKPAAVLGLPTGDTPLATYTELTARERRGEVDMTAVTVFAVDEFMGVERGARGTNAHFFAEHLPLPFRALRVPDSLADRPAPHITEFAEEVRRAGGFDLCVLGIGANGHIAFNEPGSGSDSRAGVVELAEASRRAHAAAFGSLEAVPARGLTLGVPDILEARAILVLAQGAAKAAIVARALEGPQTAEVPASWLQTHGDATWLLDRDAASRLARR